MTTSRFTTEAAAIVLDRALRQIEERIGIDPNDLARGGRDMDGDPVLIELSRADIIDIAVTIHDARTIARQKMVVRFLSDAILSRTVVRLVGFVYGDGRFFVVKHDGFTPVRHMEPDDPFPFGTLLDTRHLSVSDPRDGMIVAGDTIILRRKYQNGRDVFFHAGQRYRVVQATGLYVTITTQAEGDVFDSGKCVDVAIDDVRPGDVGHDRIGPGEGDPVDHDVRI